MMIGMLHSDVHQNYIPKLLAVTSRQWADDREHSAADPSHSASLHPLLTWPSFNRPCNNFNDAHATPTPKRGGLADVREDSTADPSQDLGVGQAWDDANVSVSE